jgi:hypothetical protein
VPSLRDLQFLRDCGARIKAEDFAKTLFFENIHRDFSPCSRYRAKTSIAQGSLGGVNSRIVQEVMFPDPFVEIEKKSPQLFKMVF